MKHHSNSTILFLTVSLLVISLILYACQPGGGDAPATSNSSEQSVEQTDEQASENEAEPADAEGDSGGEANTDQETGSDEAESSEDEADAEEGESTEEASDGDGDTAEQAAEESNSGGAEASSDPRTFQIDQDRSEARFSIDEVLLGNDKTVVGVTSMVTGEILVDMVNSGNTQIGTIQIDARDLKTDSDRRNRALQRRILQSALDENQFITFAPTTIDGVPDAVAVGDSFAANVTGDLTVSGVTRPVTFEMNVSVDSEDEISGLGTTTVLHADFELSIPKVPVVASVEDKVILEIEFTAVAQ